MAKGRKTETPTTTGESSDVVETVRGLAALVAEHSLSELIVDTDGMTITLRRGTTVMHMQQPQQAQMHAPPQHMQHMHLAPPAPFVVPNDGPGGGGLASVPDNAHVVTSPFVGTFYRRPNPDSPNYVTINEKVEKGQVLCIVEAMKLMNEIEADIAGTISAILAEDGAPVEYGQALFKITPS
jgi:acetyl-CoA carboxylase biotin carboxyl carrier protein